MPIPVYGQIHVVSYLVPTTVGIARFSSLGRAMRILTALTVFACADVALQYFVALWTGSNLIISHLYVVLESSMLCAVFYWSVPLRSTRNTLLMLGGTFVVLWATDMIFFFNPNEINTVTQLAVRIILIVMSAVTLQAIARDERSGMFERPVFWVSIAVILYSATTLMVVGLGNQLLALGISYFDVAWDINWTFIIIANILYAKGMLCKSHQ
jgi:hypothetical protein